MGCEKPSGNQVPGNVDYRDALVAPQEKPRFEDGCPLVVQEVMLPVPFHKLGDDDRQVTAGILLFEVADEGEDRSKEKTVRRLDYRELRYRHAEFERRHFHQMTPGIAKIRGMFADLDLKHMHVRG
jgi:hypothetical protein